MEHGYNVEGLRLTLRPAAVVMALEAVFAQAFVLFYYKQDAKLLQEVWLTLRLAAVVMALEAVLAQAFVLF